MKNQLFDYFRYNSSVYNTPFEFVFSFQLLLDLYSFLSTF